MFARIVKTAQDFIGSFDRNPYNYMQLLAAHGGVPGMIAAAPGSAPTEQLRKAAAISYRTVYEPRYNFFDLMADMGHAPFAATAAAPVRQNIARKAWVVIEGFANDNRVPGYRRRPRAA